MNKKENKEHKI